MKILQYKVPGKRGWFDSLEKNITTLNKEHKHIGGKRLKKIGTNKWLTTDGFGYIYRYIERK